MTERFGGIEAGGTKFVCAVGSEPDDLTDVTIIPTGTPDETIGQVINYFHDFTRVEHLSAIGIASFGPLDLGSDSDTFGHITSTPKPGWTNIDIAGRIAQAVNIPVAFDTDVNGAALGEHRWGSASGYGNIVYVTVGTGVGGGAIVNGALTHGLVHTEMGHMRVPHNWVLDPYPGVCQFHGDCLAGLASGPAIEGRWGSKAEELGKDHAAWDLEAEYLAFMAVNIVCVLSPEVLLIGGGVMQQPQILPNVRRNVQDLLGGYVRSEKILTDIDNFIVSPTLGSLSGVLGAIAMAQDLVNYRKD